MMAAAEAITGVPIATMSSAADQVITGVPTDANDLLATNSCEFFEMFDRYDDDESRIQFMELVRVQGYPYHLEAQPDAVLQRFYYGDEDAFYVAEVFQRCFPGTIICCEASFRQSHPMTIIDQLQCDVGAFQDSHPALIKRIEDLLVAFTELGYRGADEYLPEDLKLEYYSNPAYEDDLEMVFEAPAYESEREDESESESESESTPMPSDSQMSSQQQWQAHANQQWLAYENRLLAEGTFVVSNAQMSLQRQWQAYADHLDQMDDDSESELESDSESESESEEVMSLDQSVIDDLVARQAWVRRAE